MTGQDLTKALTLTGRKGRLIKLFGLFEWTEEQRVEKVFDEVLAINSREGELFKSEIGAFFNQLRLKAESEIESIDKQFSEL